MIIARGRHKRPSKASRAAKVTSAAAGTGMLGAVIATSATGPQHIITATDTAVIQPVTSSTTPLGDYKAQAEHARETAAVTYTVEKGDSLSKIATSECGNTADYTGMYLANEKTIGQNPNVIEPGTNLTVACYQGHIPETPQEHWFHENHMNHLANLAESHYTAPAEQAAPAPRENAPAQQDAVQHSDTTVNPGSYSGFQACVVERESGGNANVMNASGHYGLYQFDEGTWVSGGGSASDFGHAPVAEQNKVFANVYAARGTEPWGPSDGC